MKRTTPNWRMAPLLLLVGACAPSTSREGPDPQATRPPPVSALGLGHVIGANARALTAQFGPADLDIREGSARKLQFAGPACVLDAYLYPRSEGSEAVVTYVDARLPDGRDMDRASCVAALNARQRSR